MLKHIFFLIVVITTACTPKLVQQQTDHPAIVFQNSLSPSSLSSIPVDPSVRIGTLPNGITYYIKANAKPENRAELRMAIKAGSIEEDPDQLGIAHLVEHMAFNGSRNFSKNELVNYLESVGSRFGPDLNAYTSFDETVYMLQVRSDEADHLNKGMLILRDWADGISFDGEEIDKERGVVISEWRSGLSAEQRMQKEYLPLMYYQSRYAERLPIGDPELLKTVPYDAVRRFYKDWYRPDLTAILVVGDINVDSIETKIKQQFGTIVPSTQRAKPEVTFPIHDETFARVITDPEASNSRIRIIYKHKYQPIENLLDYRQSLVASLYSRMMGKRLTEISRKSDPPFIFGFSSYYQDVGELGTYSSYAMADAKNIRRAFQTLLEENRRVLLHGFTETELQREKAAMLRQAEQNVLEEDKLESSRVVQRFVYHFLENSPSPNAAQTLEMYKSMLPTISVEEVGRKANDWITESNRMVYITAPTKDLPVLPDSTELIRMIAECSVMDLSAYNDIDVSAPLLSGHFPVRPVLKMQHDTLLNIFHWQFENGVEVSAKPTDFKNDEILMNAYSPGGHSLYSDELYPSARSVSQVIGSSGVGAYNATALDKKLTGLRVSVVPFVFERFEGFNGSASAKDLETMMQLIYSYTTAYREDSVALNAYLSRERAMYGNLLANPDSWYFEQITRITSQNHPRRGYPAIESYDKVNLNDIMNIYRDRFKDVSDMHFFFVGNFQPDSLMTLTSRYLGALPGNGREESWKDVGERWPSGQIDTIFKKGEAPRSQVQLIYHGADHYHLDTGYVLLSLIDLARIKLRESLREEESGVYGVSIFGGQSLFPLEQYSIRVSFNAEPTRTKELIEAAKTVIEKLKVEIDETDISKVKEIQRQGRIRDLQQNQFWMTSFINSWMSNVDLAPLVQMQPYEEKISRLNKEVLLKAARKYFNEKEMISVVMYPDKT